MGLDINAARFLLGEKTRGVQLGHTLTLGRQGVYMSPEEYSGFLDRLGTTLKTHSHADDFFTAMGAEPFISMDASSYEGADLIHDINEPVTAELHSSFDTVIDGGTLEHVFNFPNAIRNCMQLVRPGGNLIMFTPWHNYSGHGFYQFSPELLYSVLSEQNGYRVERMLLVAEGNWYSVREPQKIKKRVEIVTTDPVLLYVTAKRIEERLIFQDWPQQSDYSAAWKQGSYSTGLSTYTPSFLQKLSSKIPPLDSLKTKLREKRARDALRPLRNLGLSRICPSTQIPLI